MTSDAPVTPPNDNSRVRRGGAIIALFRVGTYLLLAAAIATAAFVGYQTMQARASLDEQQATVVSSMGLVAPIEKHLAPDYTDHLGRLLADPPANAADCIDPDTLVVAFQEDTDVDNQQVDWKGLCDALAKATGKKVISQPYDNSISDVASVKKGQFQIIALHAADTPYLVNNAGFIPIGVLGGKSGPTGNKLDIAVPNSSPIHSLSDLKGRTLTCTVPSSITGYRAAVALLMLEGGLRPNVDYLINFSLKQKNSIKGVVDGKFEAAALSDDKVQSLISDGKLKAGDFRTVFQSEVIPRLTIGYVYNLKPALADQITKTILAFTNENGATDEDGDQPMKFAPVDYRQDFGLVRKIDDAFDPRFNAAAVAKDKAAPPTTAPSTT